MSKVLIKNPWLGAVLNAILPGIVYLFVGKRNKFGAFLILGIIFAIFSSQSDSNTTRLTDAISLFSVIFIQLAFAVDGYNECNEAKILLSEKEKK